MINVKGCIARHFCETQDNEEKRILWRNVVILYKHKHK